MYIVGVMLVDPREPIGVTAQVRRQRGQCKDVYPCKGEGEGVPV